MNYQEIFDKVCAHLRGMKTWCVDSKAGGCMYQNHLNQQCAIGCLIKPELRGGLYGAVNDAQVQQALRDSGIEFNGHSGSKDLLFLTKLQCTHDNENNWGPEGFAGEHVLVKIAEQFHLEYREP